MNEEQQDLLERAPPAESVPDFLSASTNQPGVIEAELFLDGRQVTGEIRSPRGSRRLVDILNALEGDYLTMHSGELRDVSGRCLEFELIQMTRSSIVLAVPRQGSASRINRAEVIEKHRRLVTIILPGCQVSGYFHVAPGVDPSFAVAGLGNRFVALTDATITVIDGDTPTRFEPIALLNTSHAQAYVWSDEGKSTPSATRTAEAVTTHEITESAETPLG
jgi:hypothetical protein